MDVHGMSDKVHNNFEVYLATVVVYLYIFKKLIKDLAHLFAVEAVLWIISDFRYDNTFFMNFCS